MSAALELLTIRFGSKGASWFALVERKGNKLVGTRWMPTYRGIGGAYAGWLTIPAANVTDRLPTCPRPALPTPAEIDAVRARHKARAAKAAARLAAAKAIQKRLDAGETVIVEFESSYYDGKTLKSVPEVKRRRVIGTEGRFLKVENPGSHYGWFLKEAANCQEVVA